MPSAKNHLGLVIYAVKWLDKFKFFRSMDSAMGFANELEQWAAKLDVKVQWEIEEIYAEVDK